MRVINLSVAMALRHKASYLDAIGASLGVESATLRPVDSAWIVSCVRKVVDVDDDRTARFVERHVVSSGRATALGRQAVSDTVTIESPSGHAAVAFAENNDGDVECRVTVDGSVIRRVKCPHGKVLLDDMVGGWSWSGDAVAYVAAQPKRKKNVIGAYEHDFDWGEKFGGVVEPSVYVLRLEDATPRRVCALAGQPCFSSKGRLAVTKFDAPKRRKLGLTYCFNRPSSVVVYDGDVATRVSDDDLARSPRWHGDTLAFLAGSFETHNGPCRVRFWRDGHVVSSTDPLWVAATLPRDAFDYADGACLVEVSRREMPCLALVDVATGEVKRWVREGAKLFAAAPGALLVHDQSPSDPGKLRLVLDDNTIDLPVKGAGSVALDLAPAKSQPNLAHELVEVAPGVGAFLVYDASIEGRRPLIVQPHGGPHTCATLVYSPSAAFLAAAGYAVLFVNYRGSTGGFDLETLPGNIGEYDVADCEAATVAALEMWDTLLDGERVAVVGGSHGGFLAAHLVAHRPDLFKVAAMRNPVCNLVSMLSTSDIPDWVLVEGLGKKKGVVRGAADDPLSLSLDDADLLELKARSPLTRVADVTAPTLIGLGLADRRVPPSQGMEWFHALDAPKKLLTYPEDDHAIDRPRSAADFWLHTREWLDQWLS